MAPHNEFTPRTIDEQIEQLSQLPSQQTHPAERDDASLVQALRRIYHLPLSNADRTFLERARQSILDGQTRDITLDHANTLQDQRDGSGPLQWNVEQRKRSTIVRILSSLAAVILVGALVGSWILVTHLAVHHQAAQKEPRVATSNSGEPLTTIQMVDQQNGWALTSASILLTSNGGVHWTDVSPANLHHIVGLQGTFPNASTAWVTGETSENIHIRLLHTTDGGKHWDIAFTPIQGFVIGHPDFINAQEGWLEIGTGAATGNEGVDIYRTTDGGKIWAKLSSTDFQTGKAPGHLPWKGVKSGISFLNAETGWATGSAGGAPNVFWFYVTHDGGATWQQQNLTWPKGLINPSASLSPPLFFGEDGLLPILINDATHHTLVLYSSHDGGATWQSTTLGPGASILAASDAKHIWTTDTHALFVTSDGGYHWNQVVPHIDFTNVSALAFISSQVGWAIGGRERPQPLLFKTTDGGRTWTEITYSIS